MALTAFMLLSVCAGLSGATVARGPLRSISFATECTWTSLRLRKWNSQSSGHKLSLFFVFQFACKPFQLVTPVELAHLLRIFPPIRRDFNKQPQVDFAGEDGFKFLAGFRSNFFEHLAFVADEYLFLRIALHVHDRFDAQQLGSLFISFNHHRECVWHLVVHHL